MSRDFLVPVKGANWKHTILNKLARSKEFPTRLRIFNILKALFNINLIKTTTESGLVLLLDLSDWVQYQIYFYGNYEKKSVALFKELSRDAKYIFDVGSHIGQYSLECAYLDHSNAKIIYAIEANPKTFTYLLNNIQLNNFKQVKPVLGAISNQNHLVEIDIPTYWNLGNTQINSNKAQQNNNGYLIATYNLSSLINSQQIESIDLMKIDIEGHEYLFFSHLFENKIFPKKIIFEYIPDTFKEIILCTELMRANDYLLYTIDRELFTDQNNVSEQNLLAIYQKSSF